MKRFITRNKKAQDNEIMKIELKVSDDTFIIEFSINLLYDIEYF